MKMMLETEEWEGTNFSDLFWTFAFKDLTSYLNQHMMNDDDER